MQIILPGFHIVRWPIIRQPNRLSHEVPLGLNIILAVQREPMVDPGRNHNHISRHDLDPHPAGVLTVAHVKVSGSVYHEPNLLVRVQMLGEEALQLVLVVRQTVLGAGDFVLVAVTALLADSLQYTIAVEGRNVDLCCLGKERENRLFLERSRFVFSLP